MPQPIKRKGRAVRMSPAVVVERPHLGLSIAIIASHWTKLEATLSLIYTYLLGGQEETAFQFYHDLVDLSLRKKALMTAAKNRLSKELIGEIEELFGDIRKLASARNAVIHGTWATMEVKQDALLLCEPKDLNEKVNQVFRHLRRMTKNPKSQTVSVDLTPEKFIEYKHRDFDDINRRIIKLDERATAISNKVLARSLELVAKPSGPDE